jgi:hypothetical protein
MVAVCAAEFGVGPGAVVNFWLLGAGCACYLWSDDIGRLLSAERETGGLYRTIRHVGDATLSNGSRFCSQSGVIPRVFSESGVDSIGPICNL